MQTNGSFQNSSGRGRCADYRKWTIGQHASVGDANSFSLRMQTGKGLIAPVGK